MAEFNVMGIANAFVAQVTEAAVYFEHLDLYEVGGVLLVLGVLLYLFGLHRRHVQRKVKEQAYVSALEKAIRGLQMKVSEKDKVIVRRKELLTEIITDLVLTLSANKKISEQEEDELYQEFAERLGMPDLIPRERRARIVKKEIKDRLNNGLYKNKVPVNPKPTRKVVPDIIGRARKYWRKAS